jgi:hypothetical protein
MMSQQEPPLEQLLPVELKLRILETELERLEADARWVQQRRREILQEIDACNEVLDAKRRRCLLRRIK